MEAVAVQPGKIAKWENRARSTRGCPKHGHMYDMPQTALCGHYDCRKAWLLKCCEKHAPLRRQVTNATRWGMLDDMLQYMAIRFLEELKIAEAGGWFPYMSAKWLWYVSVRFMKLRAGGRDNGRFVAFGQSDSASGKRGASAAMASLEDAVSAHVAETNPNRLHNAKSDSMTGRQIQVLLTDNGMDLEMLVLRGDMTAVDAWKIGTQRERERVAKLPADAAPFERQAAADDLPTVEARVEWLHAFLQLWVFAQFGGDDGEA